MDLAICGPLGPIPWAQGPSSLYPEWCILWPRPHCIRKTTCSCYQDHPSRAACSLHWKARAMNTTYYEQSLEHTTTTYYYVKQPYVPSNDQCAIRR